MSVMRHRCGEVLPVSSRRRAHPSGCRWVPCARALENATLSVPAGVTWVMCHLYVTCVVPCAADIRRSRSPWISRPLEDWKHCQPRPCLRLGHSSATIHLVPRPPQTQQTIVYGLLHDLELVSGLPPRQRGAQKQTRGVTNRREANEAGEALKPRR